MLALNIDITVEEDHEVAGNLVDVTRIFGKHRHIIRDVNRYWSQQVLIAILASDLILDFIVDVVDTFRASAISCTADSDHRQCHGSTLFSILPILQDPRALI